MTGSRTLESEPAMLVFDISARKQMINALEAACKLASRYGLPASYGVEDEIRKLKKELVELQAFAEVLGQYTMLECRVQRLQSKLADMADEPEIKAALVKFKEFNERK